MKLTLVSIIVRNVRYSAFIYLQNGQTVTYQALCDMFPIMRTLRRGETWSYG